MQWRGENRGTYREGGTWQVSRVGRRAADEIAGREDEEVWRDRFGANTVRSGKGRIALDSRIDFRRTWSFTFYSNHSIIANGWTLSEQMAINLTGLIPFRHLSCVSASLARAVFNLDWHDCTQGLLSLILPFFLSIAWSHMLNEILTHIPPIWAVHHCPCLLDLYLHCFLKTTCICNLPQHTSETNRIKKWQGQTSLAINLTKLWQ